MDVREYISQRNKTKRRIHDEFSHAFLNSWVLSIEYPIASCCLYAPCQQGNTVYSKVQAELNKHIREIEYQVGLPFSFPSQQPNQMPWILEIGRQPITAKQAATCPVTTQGIRAQQPFQHCASALKPRGEAKERPQTKLAIRVGKEAIGMAATAYSVVLLGGARLPAVPRSGLLPRRSSACPLRLQTGNPVTTV
jgi:hypothetical protein